MQFETIRNIENEHYMKTFSRYNIALVRGEGYTLYDSNGKSYTDFFAGIAVNALGYNHPALTQALETQAKKLWHCSNLFYNDTQSQAVQALLQDSDFDRVFFCNSGAEANEGALKAARKYHYLKTPRPRIVSALNSFHGRTLFTAAATGQTKYSAPFAPLPEQFTYVPYNDIAALERELTEDVAAFIVETIQGEGGVVPATVAYLQAAEQICRKNDIIFIIDEVQTGIGRTGTFFSYEAAGIHPDCITLAKALGGGMPIGAFLTRGALSEALVPGDHGSTFGGNALACACALAVVSTVRTPEFLQHVQETGRYLQDKLTDIQKALPDIVGCVRGKGLLLGMQLHASVSGKEIVAAMLDKGFILNCAGQNTLRFAPPLIIDQTAIDNMATALLETLQNQQDLLQAKN